MNKEFTLLWDCLPSGLRLYKNLLSQAEDVKNKILAVTVKTKEGIMAKKAALKAIESAMEEVRQ